MSVKPLKQLFAEADALIGKSSQHSKVAAAAFPSDEVANLAEALISAGALEKVAEAESVMPNQVDSDFEKIAIALNRAEAASQLEYLEKLSQFENQAKDSGYSDDQIEEAIEKIAAKEVKHNLSILTALSADVPSPANEDKNCSKANKVNTKGKEQGKIDKSVTENAGYGS